MQEHSHEEHAQGGVATATRGAQRSKHPSGPKPALQHPTTPRRVKLLSNLALVALLGIILLTLSLWLGGIHLPFLTTVPDQPSLSLSSGPYHVGSVITLQGAHFSHFAIIAVLLDGQPVVDSNGWRVAVDSDGQGAFRTTLTITSAWSLGDHILTAKDTNNSQRALIDLVIEKSTG